MSCIEVTASLITLDFPPNARTVSFLHFQKTFLENISTGESGAFGLWFHPRGSSRISS